MKECVEDVMGGKKEIIQDFINNMMDGKMIELDRKTLKA